MDILTMESMAGVDNRYGWGIGPTTAKDVIVDDRFEQETAKLFAS